MVFLSLFNEIINYIIVLFIMILIILIIFTVKHKNKKNTAICLTVLLTLGGVWYLNCYMFGIASIEEPLIRGDNAYHSYSQKIRYVHFLRNIDSKKVAYSEENDPTRANGTNNVTNIIYNNGEKITYIINYDYLLIRHNNNKDLFKIKPIN